MKKYIISISTILLIIISAINYHFSFPIQSDHSNLENNIQKWLNRGSDFEYDYNIYLYDSVTLHNLTYIPMEVDEKIGYILLKKGFTGNYKIIHSGYGNTAFRNGIINIGGQKYLLFIGRNSFGKIAKAKFTLSPNIEYEINIPNQKIFLTYAEVDNNTQTDIISLENIKLYNDKEEDITSEFNLSGSDIK